MDMVYKLARLPEWQEAERTGNFRGSPDDLRDGFLHFSAAHQLRATAEKHFAGQARLVLLTVEAAPLGAALQWELSRGGDRFPHLYGPLRRDQVLRAQVLSRGADGRVIFPPEIPDG